MYIPRSFREERIDELHALIEAHPFGLLITHGARGLQATPVPFLLYPAEGAKGVLRAHLARANPHWQDLDHDHECLVIFQGANGYVTPSWYPSKAETQRVVPTWNYVAVEVRGKPMAVEDAAWLHRLVDDLSDRHEGIRPRPWSVDDAPADYIDTQLQAVVGIEIAIERIEGKWKLSQNKPEADRLGVITGMREESDPHANARLVALMKRS